MEDVDASDVLLTPGQTAKLFGVTTRTLINWGDKGKLRPAQRTGGGHRRYREAEALALRAILRPAA